MEEQKNFSNFVTATGMLAGATFASLVLLIQIEDKLEYSEIMIPFVAGITVMFVFSLIEFARFHQKFDSKKRQKIEDTAFITFTFGLFGLIVMIPLLILPFSFLSINLESCNNFQNMLVVPAK